MGAKEAALHILDALTAFFVFSALTVSFHEYVHSMVARAFGGSATVVYYLFSGYTRVEGAFTPLQLALIALSGGLGCFLLFLYMFLWWLEDPSDKYTRVPCLYFMVNQFVYGWLELAGLIYPLLIPFPIACLVATVVAMGATLTYMFRFWD